MREASTGQIPHNALMNLNIDDFQIVQPMEAESGMAVARGPGEEKMGRY